MPSERQREANRLNGRLGGPKARPGKRRSRMNSLRHGRVETGMLDITVTSQRDLARQVVEDCPEPLDPDKAIGVAFVTAPPDQWHNSTPPSHAAPARAPDEMRRRGVRDGRCRSNGSV